jgi:hypothetical protein
MYRDIGIKRYFPIGSNEYCASGILFTNLSKQKITKYLVYSINDPNKIHNLEDIGGKSDSRLDFNIMWTAVRETVEELNGLLADPKRCLETIQTSPSERANAMYMSSKYIWDLLENGEDVRRILNPRSKYVTYVIPFPNAFSIQHIGEYEIGDNNSNRRKFMWLSKKEIFDGRYKPNPRLIQIMKKLD